MLNDKETVQTVFVQGNMLNKTHAMIKKQYKQYSSKVICLIRPTPW